jgi:hypothetical protein
MIFEICVHEVGVHGVRDICADEEAVRVHLGHHVCATALFGEGLADLFEGGGEEVGVSSLAEERAYFFVIEAADELDGAGGGVGGVGRGDEGFDGGEGAEFVVDAAGEDKFLF